MKKNILLFSLLLLNAITNELFAQRIMKVEQVFKGLQNKENNWQLCFEDKKRNNIVFTHNEAALNLIFFTVQVAIAI